jgi:hypothetical protein
MTSRAIAVALIFTLLGSGSVGSAQNPLVLSAIADSLGVRVVSHPGDTDPITVRLVENLRIGVVDGDTAYQFNRIGQVAVDRQGRVYVANGTMTIRVYGPDGKFIRTLGRRGQGPGEFTGIDRLWFTGDTLVVTSLSARRATLFSGSGQMLAAWDLRLADEGRAELLAHRPNGWLAWVRPKSHATSLAFLTLFQDTAQLRMYDPVSKQPAAVTLRRQPGPRAASQADLYPGTPLFEPRSVTAIGTDGSQYFAANGQYTIDVFDPGGLHVRRISRAVPPKPITRQHIQMLYDFLDSPERAGGPPRSRRGSETRLGIEAVEKLPLAPAFAVIGAMLVAPDGSLLVQRIDGIDPIQLEWITGFNAAERASALILRGPTRWERFDAQGRYIGPVTIPARYQPRYYDGRQVVGVLRDGDGVEFVVRYRFEA